MEDRRLEEAHRLVPQRVDVPGEDPRVETAVRPVHHPGVGEVEDERPAHQRHENGVAGEREDDLTPRDRRRRGQRAGPLPRRDEDDRTGQRRDRNRGPLTSTGPAGRRPTTVEESDTSAGRPAAGRKATSRTSAAEHARSAMRKGRSGREGRSRAVSATSTARTTAGPASGSARTGNGGSA